jgi:hypothetical protein
MDKLKLVRIISKDLEEIKILTDEVAENQDNSSLIIDLALSRARLLCQELEVLRSLSNQEDSLTNEIEDESIIADENEVSELTISDPELEIVNFDVPDLDDEEEISEEDVEDVEEMVVYDSEDDLDEEAELNSEDNIEEDEEKEEEEESEDEIAEDEEDFHDESEEDIEEDDFNSIEEEENELNEEKAIEYEEQEEASLEEAKKAVQHAVREIKIHDLDDEEDEELEFTPVSSQAGRPVMREIPKPEIIETKIPFEEEPEPEELEEEEPIQKERTLNETLGENKAAEPPLSNSPISSLRASIGLNDRFLFIKEIFNNNTEKYNTIIDQLDKMETIQQAVDYLKGNLSLQKNETSLKFVELLKRRFSK